MCYAFVKVVRVVPVAVRTCLQTLGGAAEYLLGEFRTVEEKTKAFGQMQSYDEGIVSGYAGGGDYGTDQFLETRGAGKGAIIPNIDAEVAPAVIGGRVSALADDSIQRSSCMPVGMAIMQKQHELGELYSVTDALLLQTS